MAVTEESEARVRELREKAEEYGDRVRAGEEPWTDGEDANSAASVLEQSDEDGQTEVDETVKDVRDEDVGETESDAPEVTEVNQEDPAPEPTE